MLTIETRSWKIRFLIFSNEQTTRSTCRKWKKKTPRRRNEVSPLAECRTVHQPEFHFSPIKKYHQVLSLLCLFDEQICRMREVVPELAALRTFRMLLLLLLDRRFNLSLSVVSVLFEPDCSRPLAPVGILAVSSAWCTVVARDAGVTPSIWRRNLCCDLSLILFVTWWTSNSSPGPRFSITNFERSDFGSGPNYIRSWRASNWIKFCKFRKLNLMITTEDVWL